ncbi:central glycolytic genes regulator [Natranaerovirga hydrolytica]|uniref:Central glycolytic genes regulator n=1 Tax=Natranaerovirga hydrolytica TaxID=680378 RepID=A0A4R1N3C8_9FIRM|nr:sugar-binding domain-containing protein [Natranaerovirga hydrolytica]TCK98544.1 central glycolytic genes regulator [Natranaerovirga hydrolytica]
MDYKLLNALKKIIPNEIEILHKRYDILSLIKKNQPIGRRSLAKALNSTEKIIRNEIEFLKSIGYVEASSSGMHITKEGDFVLHDIEGIIYSLNDLYELELQVKQILNCEKVIVVLGDTDQDKKVKEDIGKAAAKVLMGMIKEDTIIAIAGGSTVYHVIQSVKTTKKNSDVLVLPARGSLRNNVEYQANSLVASLADKLSSKYELLNIPDNLSRKTLDSVKNEPDIQSTINKILKANIILCGIGNAYEMAEKRNLATPFIDFLERKEAVSEALGYYFNKKGEIVYTSRSIGIKLEQMTKTAYPIAVAGGKRKANAILSVKDFMKKGCLIIDEGAAREIIRINQL